MLKRILSALLVFCLISHLAFPQTVEDTVEPKLGLVLSGGGAKGFAHIGMLKVMEEVGLRPDFITGTSMGSVVGGLYALGMTAQELEDFATTQDWGFILSNDVDLRQINITEKEDFGKQLLSLEYQDDQFGIPQGLIEGQQLSLTLARLACSANLMDDFSEFPIPFQCVAVNVLNGEIVDMDSGYLATALRASMAIPFLFTPVEYEGKLLVDGGVKRNFPVQEAIDMGANILIGSYTGSEDQTTDDLKSGIEILVQTSFLGSVQDSKEQKLLCDLVIECSKGYTPADFDKAAEIIAQGEELTRQYIDELRAIAQKLNKVKADQPEKSLHPGTELHIDKIDYSAIPTSLQALVKNSIGLKEGRTYGIREIERGINYVFGTRFFKKVTYRISSDDGGTTMHLDVKEVAPLTLGFGLHYSNADNAAVILKANYKSLKKRPYTLSGQVRVSEFPSVNLYYNDFFGEKRKLLCQFGAAYQSNNQNISLLNGGVVRSYTREKMTLLGQVMYAPKHNFLIGLGYEWDRFKIGPDNSEELDFSDFDAAGFSFELFFKQNSIERVNFPHHGRLIEFSAAYHHSYNYDIDYTSEEAATFLAIGEEADYFKAHLFFSNYSQLTHKITAFQHIGLGVTDKSIIFDNFALGGDFFTGQQAVPFAGIREYRAPFSNIASAQMGLRYHIIENLSIALRANVAKGSDEVELLAEDIDLLYGGGITLGYDSLIGPMNVTVGRSNLRDDLQVAVNLGYRFKYR